MPLDLREKRRDQKTINIGPLLKLSHPDVCPTSRMSNTLSWTAVTSIDHLTTLRVCGLPSGPLRLLH